MFDIRELNIAIEMWGAALCALGVVSSLLFMRTDRRVLRKLLFLFSTELTACLGDAVAGIYRGEPGQLAWIATHAGNLIAFSSNFLLMAIYTSYLCTRIRRVSGSDMRRWRLCVWVAAGIMCILTALGAFYGIDSHNVYHRSSLYWVTYVYAAIIGVVDSAFVIRNRARFERLAFVALTLYCILPAVAMTFQVLVYGRLNFVIAAEILLSVMLFLEAQFLSARTLVKRTEELAASRVEVAESRIAVMVSQIQPHFLFNTLDSIYYLCGEDPSRAQEAVDRFSTYLRANLDSLKRQTPTPIEAELAHVRTYLELEELSMEELLTWEIDAPVRGFLVPALSLQTLAENAVKHGISKRPHGGHVAVRTSEEADAWLAIVEDDGVGFDPTLLDEGQGVGIENTRLRLASMCGGSLSIVSSPGTGAKIIMRIPKGASRSLGDENSPARVTHTM